MKRQSLDKNLLKFCLTVSLLLTVVVIISSFKNQRPKITEVQLGTMLFNDKILSNKQTISCASCHKPGFAFSDTVPFSLGDEGKPGKRNAPGITNLAERNFYFYDGRAASLEEQVLFPIADKLEMNLPISKAIERLNANAQYVDFFDEVYKQKPNELLLAKAIAAFEKTLETSNSAWDRYAKGDKKAVNTAVLRGRKIFNTKGKCFDCHSGVDFTNDEFRNIGLYNGYELNDKGRADFTKKNEDVGKFKVPGLRNVALTAPYMHNGMFKSLKEVLNYYNNPTRIVSGSINTDSLLVQPLNLSPSELDDLEAFLNALTDQQFLEVSLKQD
jgi:cytochrome c peroxidase